MPQVEEHARLNAWLDMHGPDDIDICWLESFDVSDYLKQTEAFPISPSKRIHLLCIFLVDEKHIAALPEFHRSWQALQRIFDEAHRLDPDDPFILVSNAISARDFAVFAELDNDEKTIIALFGTAKGLLKRALALDADDASLLHSMGLTEYDGPSGDSRRALPWFERACQSDPKDPWPHLYRAHCLHDLQDWNAAVAAYESVDGSAFDERRSWRADKLLEQLAWCRLKAGDRSGALEGFRKVLKIYSGMPSEDIPVPTELIEAAAGPLRVEICSDVLVLLKRLGWEDEIERLSRPSPP